MSRKARSSACCSITVTNPVTSNGLECNAERRERWGLVRLDSLILRLNYMLILKLYHATGLSGSLGFTTGLLNHLTEKDKYRHGYLYSFMNYTIFEHMCGTGILSKFVPLTGVFL